MKILHLIAILALAGGCAKEPVTMTKPGVSKEQAQRDQRECEEDAEKASKQLGPDSVKIRRRVMASCMRGRGYDTNE